MPGIKTLSSQEIAEVAHELRAPLGGIEAMVEMLEAGPLDAGQTRVVRALRASVAHLRGLADRVLDAPGNPDTADATGVASSPCCSDLETLLGSLETACQARANARSVHFRLEVADHGILKAQVDAGPLRQVLENLIDNAFRLMTAGTVTLDVTRSTAGRLRFRITDEGPGISTEDAARLIRDGGKIDGRAGGAGLGLSIAGRLVAAHGGTLIGGPSAAGAGATFTFEWRDESHADLADCLIVDDHPASRLVLRTILGSVGHRCLEAESVPQALQMIAAQPPEFVLTDLNMPGGNGMELIAEIHAMPSVIRPKVLVVSADEIDASHPVHALADAAVRKPITVRSVLEAMAHLAQARNQTRAA